MKPSFNRQENYKQQILHWHNVLWTQIVFAIKTHSNSQTKIYWFLFQAFYLIGLDNRLLLRETETKTERTNRWDWPNWTTKLPSNLPVESQKMSTKSWWIRIRRAVWPNYWGQRHHPRQWPRPSPSELRLCWWVYQLFMLFSLCLRIILDFCILFFAFCQWKEDQIKDKRRKEKDRGDNKQQMLQVWSENHEYADTSCVPVQDTACEGVTLRGLKVSGLNLHLL